MSLSTVSRLSSKNGQFYTTANRAAGSTLKQSRSSRQQPHRNRFGYTDVNPGYHHFHSNSRRATSCLNLPYTSHQNDKIENENENDDDVYSTGTRRKEMMITSNHPVSLQQLSALQSHTQSHHRFPSQLNNMSAYSQQSLMSNSNIMLSQTRPISSVADLVPEFAKSWSIFGLSGIMLKTFHHDGLIPYWACMSITNIMVRSSMIPLVIKGAHTSVKFANVAPEVQFLVTCFQNDMKRMKDEKATAAEQFALMRITWQSLRGIYKLHDVSPLQVLKSPLLQLPIFYYFSIDIRKIINGGDPELAQQLADSSFLWVTDLTEPDPWYGLPILSGMLLYLNVEVAVGKKSLSGETASQSNVARVLKDFFQSLAVFMPCFMSHSPAGVQIYLMTSFMFTLFQGAALRNDSCRALVGLPAVGAPLPEAKYAKEFMELKRLEKEAAEARGEGGEVLGLGSVLAPGFQISFAGTARPSTIQSNTIITSTKPISMKEVNFESFTPPVDNNMNEVYIPPCIKAPPVIPEEYEVEAPPVPKKKPVQAKVFKKEKTYEVTPSAEEIMEAANRGERAKPTIRFVSEEEEDKSDAPLNLKRLKTKRKAKSHRNRSKSTRRKR